MMQEIKTQDVTYPYEEINSLKMAKYNYISNISVKT